MRLICILCKMNDFYNAYLLRVQRSDANSSWRVVLEDVHTGEVRYFASQIELLLYLLRKFDTRTRHKNPNSID